MIRTLVTTLWIAGGIAQMALCGAMLRRKLHHEYPKFFLFVTASIAEFWTFLAISVYAYHLYFSAFWTCSLLNIAIEFAVLYEMFEHIFRPYESLRRLGTILFRWVCVVVVVVAIAVAITSVPVSKIPVINVIISLDRSVYLMQVGLVLFMLLLAPYVGLRMRHRVFGLALGFGIYAAIELISTLGFSGSTRHAVPFMNVIRESVWLTAIVVWTAYAWLPEPERRRARQFERPEEWNSTLNGIAYGKPEAAFLPNVVDTVEKVLARRASALILDGNANRTTLKN